MASRAARVRNPRGRGGRLRDELIEAASALLAEGRPLTLRSVAARVGVAATSVYLHFATVEELSAAVAERSFAAMGAALAAAEPGAADPRGVMLARCRAYCAFALAHPGHYRVMFEADRPDIGPGVPHVPERSVGWPALERLTANVRRCQEAGQARSGDPLRLALQVWATLHGLVTLRLGRPRLPWPPLDDLVDEAVGQLLAPGGGDQ